jgi:hypothetical protein
MDVLQAGWVIRQLLGCYALFASLLVLFLPPCSCNVLTLEFAGAHLPADTQAV